MESNRFRASCSDIARCECHFSCTAVKRWKMFLTDSSQTSSIHSFNQLTIRCFEWTENSDIAGLELVGRMGRYTTKDDVVFEAVLYGFDRLMGFEAVNDQDAWLLLRPRFGLGIEDTFEPFEADLGVSISRVGVCIVPSRGTVR